MHAKPIGDPDHLAEFFRSHEKPRDRWRIGMEAEKFAVDMTTGKPLAYEGERGVRSVYEWLSRHHGWTAHRETADGPLIALQRSGSWMTLEPGAQVELSGSPMPDLHQVARELQAAAARHRKPFVLC